MRDEMGVGLMGLVGPMGLIRPIRPMAKNAQNKSLIDGRTRIGPI